MLCYISHDWESSAAMNCSSSCSAFATSSKIMAFSERILSFSFCNCAITFYNESKPKIAHPSAR